MNFDFWFIRIQSCLYFHSSNINLLEYKRNRGKNKIYKRQNFDNDTNLKRSLKERMMVSRWVTVLSVRKRCRAVTKGAITEHHVCRPKTSARVNGVRGFTALNTRHFSFSLVALTSIRPSGFLLPSRSKWKRPGWTEKKGWRSESWKRIGAERERRRGVNPPLFTVGISNCGANVVEYASQRGIILWGEGGGWNRLLGFNEQIIETRNFFFFCKC